MKRNALFRIILWSIIIAILTTVMVGIGFGVSFNRRRVDIAEAPLELVTMPVPAEGINAIVTANALNVRQSPSASSPAIGVVYESNRLLVRKTETVDNVTWAYITYPTTGWIMTKYIELLPGTVIDSTNQDVQATEQFQTVSSGVPAVVTANSVNVRSAPNTDATVMGAVHRDDQITVTRTESVAGVTWAYTTSPVAGWIQAEYLDMPSGAPAEDNSQDASMTQPPQIEETMVSGNIENKDSFSTASIRELEIEWAAGDILIQPSDSDQIIVKEDGVTDEKYGMVIQQDEDTLKIRYCTESFGHGFGISFGTELKKDLTIYVPRDWYCESLEIDAASATVEISDLNIGEVDFDGASGACAFENCTVKELNIDTASGDVLFVGSLEILDCDAASASVFAALSNVPNRLDMDMMSGDLDLTLPADAGFSLRMDAMNDNFTSEFQTELKNGSYVAGDGFCRINIDALSGDVTIRKGA